MTSTYNIIYYIYYVSGIYTAAVLSAVLLSFLQIFQIPADRNRTHCGHTADGRIYGRYKAPSSFPIYKYHCSLPSLPAPCMRFFVASLWLVHASPVLVLPDLTQNNTKITRFTC